MRNIIVNFQKTRFDSKKIYKFVVFWVTFNVKMKNNDQFLFLLENNHLEK